MLADPDSIPEVSGSDVVAVAPTGEERRRAPRAPVRAEISFESEDNFFTGFSSDLSTGGCFIVTGALLQRGERVTLHLTLPNGQRIEAEGEVRWVRPPHPSNHLVLPGMGIQFVGMDADSRAAVDAFMAQRQPLFLEDW